MNDPNREQFTSPEIHRYTVIGSGVIGLLTAGELASRGHDVTVISNEGQPTSDADTTSANAIGQFLPWLPPEHAEKVMSGDVESGLQEIVGDGREFYETLAASPEATGVMAVRNVELVNDELPWPMGLPEAMATDLVELDEPISIIGPDGLPAEMTHKYEFDTFSINAKKPLFILQRLRDSRA